MFRTIKIGLELVFYLFYKGFFLIFKSSQIIGMATFCYFSLKFGYFLVNLSGNIGQMAQLVAEEIGFGWDGIVHSLHHVLGLNPGPLDTKWLAYQCANWPPYFGS